MAPTPPVYSPAGIPEHVPGEPPLAGASGPALVVRALLGLLAAPAILGVLAPAWLLFLVGAAVLGAPPNVPSAAEVRRYLVAAWRERPPSPGLSLPRRLWLTARVALRAVTIPLPGLAWLLDEVLYRRALDAVRVEAPLFEISAARSGSTQLARYLEDDPALTAPNFLQEAVPYLWAWRLLPATLGRVVTADHVRHAFELYLPEAFRERHEGDPFRMDTFEAATFLLHLTHLAPLYGPRFGAQEVSEGAPSEATAPFWEGSFVDYLDRIGRKHLLWVGAPAGERRLFVKGHFLAAAPTLARRFPDARFVAMTRAPRPRMQSFVNYLRANPLAPPLGAAPWPWLAEMLVATEHGYAAAEEAFFGAADGPTRCVVRFDDYVADLPGTLDRVYRTCLDRAPPADAPREHPPRRRGGYLLNRPLDAVGIDGDALDASLAGWRQWSERA